MQATRPRMWALLVLALGGAGAFAATQGAPVEAADHNDPPDRVHSTAFGMPRATTDDAASDIADVFVWNRGTGTSQTTVFAMSYDGPNAAGAHPLRCDRDVLYQIHIAADGGTCETTHDDGSGSHQVPCSGTPTAMAPCGMYQPMGTGPTQACAHPFSDMHTINVRFAQNGMAGCAVRAEFAAGDGATPISAGIVQGMTETTITSGMISLYAGLRDDAFFFDLQGFHNTLTSGHLMFTGADFFAGMNTPVIVIEVPTSAITHSTHALPPSSTAFRVWGSTARFH